MKKNYFLLSLVFAVLFIFSCDMQVPSAVEIKGSPSLKFSADMDFSDIFSDVMKESFDSGSENYMVVQDCINVPNIKTFLVYKEIINMKPDFPSEYMIGNSYIVPTGGIKLRSSDEDEPVTLPLQNFGNLLEGFKFDESKIKSSLFVGGTDIVDKMEIELTFDSASVTIEGFTDPKTSGVNKNSDTFSATVMPSGGKSVDISSHLVNQNDLVIKTAITLPANTYEASLLNDPLVVIELVVWIPLVLVADGDVSLDGEKGAALNLPNLAGIGSFISEIPDMIKSLQFDIVMNRNPFSGGLMVIKSDTLNKKTPVTGNSLKFAFTESDVKTIADSDPFEPEFSIFLKNGSNMEIPKDFKIMTISLEAKIDHTIDF